MTKKFVLLLALALAAGTLQPAQAANPESNYQDVLVAWMDTAYMCKDQIGDAHIGITRMVMVSALEKQLHSHSKAVLATEEIEQSLIKINSQPDPSKKQLTMHNCLIAYEKAQHAVQLEKAKLDLHDK